MSNPWPIVPLGEVLKPVSRPEPVDPARTYRILGAHWYAKGLYVKDALTGSGIRADRVYRVQQGDFVYNRLFAWKGSFAVASEEHEGCYVSNEFPCFTLSRDRADGNYLWKYFSRSSAWDDALELSSGGTPTSRNRLKEDKFLAMKISLPSLSEQRRIVARIDELTAKIEQARGLRRQAMKEAELLLSSELGAKFGALASHVPVKPLGELTSHVVDGPHVTPEYLPEGLPGIPFVTVKNMVSGKLSFNDVNYISYEDHRLFTARCKAERGDVLYSKDGATRGRPCFVDTDREFSFFVSVALIKPLREQLDGRYLAHVLNSNWIKDRMTDKSRGDMIPHIVLREIKEFPIPLPPLTMQRSTVARLDHLQAKVEGLKALQTDAAAELDAMLPSILDKAFKGEP